MIDEKYLSELMRIAKLVGGKFIIVEDGKPSYVLMSYSEFDELASHKAAADLVLRAEKLTGVEDVINKQITKAQIDDLREQVIVEDITLTKQVVLENGITVEPLD